MEKISSAWVNFTRAINNLLEEDDPIEVVIDKVSSVVEGFFSRIGAKCLEVVDTVLNDEEVKEVIEEDLEIIRAIETFITTDIPNAINNIKEFIFSSNSSF